MNGTVTFHQLSVNTVGTGYSFRMASPGLADQQSGFFAITGEPAPVAGPPRLLVAPGANKRWLVSATTGLPVYLAGAHTWNVFQDRSDHANMDYPALLAKMQSNWDSPHGGLALHRLIKLWAWEDNANTISSLRPIPLSKMARGTYNFGLAGNCTLTILMPLASTRPILIAWLLASCSRKMQGSMSP